MDSVAAVGRFGGVAGSAGFAAAFTSLVLGGIGWYAVVSAHIEDDPVAGPKAVLGLGMGAVVVCAIARSARRWLRDRRGSHDGAGGVWFFVVVCAAVVAVPAVRAILPIRQAHSALRLAGVQAEFALYEAALAAAVVAVVLAVASMGSPGSVSARAGLSTFLIALVVIGGSSAWWVYRSASDPWQPSITAEPGRPAAVPNTLGAERYRLRAGFDEQHMFLAGDGFISLTYAGITAYDGATGAVRWTVDTAPLDRSPRGAVTFSDGEDSVGLFVFGVDQALIALDAGTGKVVWSRRLPGRIGEVIGGRALLGVTSSRNGVGGYFASLDPATGRELWMRDTVGTRAAGAAGQFRIAGEYVDARTGRTEFTLAGGTHLLRSDGYWQADRTGQVQVVSKSGVEVDRFSGERIVGGDDGLVLVSGVEGEGYRPRLRDIRARVDIPISGLPAGDWRAAGWLRDRAVVASWTDELALADRSGAVVSISPGPTCTDQGRLTHVVAIPGGVLAVCRGSGEDEVIGLR